MKNKLFLTCIISTFIVTCTFAQQQKAKEVFGATVKELFAGDYTYQFVRQENGKDLKVGPFEMNAAINDKYNNYKTFWELTVTGKYNLKGNYSNGNLHGAVTMNANLLISATNGDKESYKSSFSGYFKNGVPDGNFNVNHVGNKVNVNYKNGVLVGAYYVKGWGSDGVPFTTSGTLNSEGKPTGTWKFENLHSQEITFSNAVVVNRSDYDADLRTKAKSYASGSISKEKLLAEKICVRMDSLVLGYDATVNILHDGIDWEKIGGYDFSNPNVVKYYYLDRLPTLSSAGYEKLKKGVLEYIKVGGNTYDLTKDYISEETRVMLESYSKTKNLCFDEGAGLYFMSIHKRDYFSGFCVGYPDWSNYIESIYLLPEQEEELQRLVHEARLENLDKIPITDLQYVVNEGCEYRIKEDFIPCKFDQDIIVFECVVHRPQSVRDKDDVLYFSRDTFEDYFISNGYGKTILDISPEGRKEIIKNKIEVSYISNAENWFNNYILNKPYSDLATFNETRNIPAESSSLFPIISYKTLGVEQTEQDEYIVKARVDVPVPEVTTLRSIFSSADKSELQAYNTYDITVFFSGIRVSLATFVESNFVKVKNDYDIIAELDEQIKVNDDKIKSFSKTTFKSNYSSYKTHVQGRVLIIDHQDLQASIKARKNEIAIQERVFEFVDLIERIQKGDAEVTSKCEEHKDVLKAYSAYAATRDLSWNPNWSLEKMEGFLTVQRGVFDFVDKLNEINSGDNEVKTKSVDKKDVLKAYSAYVKTRDLGWNKDWSLEKLDGYVAVQKTCLEFLDLREVIMTNDVKIKSLKSTAPNIFKAYINYSSKCDITWKPYVDFETVNSLIDIQEKYLKAVDRQDISKIDKNIKKQKMTDIVKILDLEELK